MTHLICGEALFDLFAEETPTGFLFDARIGGSPFNVALGLARLGQPAALFTGLSTDFPGARLRKAMASEGIDQSYLVETDAPTTLSLVGLGPDGSPDYAFRGTGAADRSLTEDDLPALGDDVATLHFGSYALVVEPTGSSELALARREKGRRLLTLDPNVRPTVEPSMALWRERIDAFAKTASIIKLSDEDAERLYGEATLDDVARRLLERGPSLVVVTRGVEGAIGFTPTSRVTVPAPAIRMVDAVGAGDTFQAALITALDELGLGTPDAVARLTEDSLERVLGFAAGAAALTCTRRGADLPRRADLPPLS